MSPVAESAVIALVGLVLSIIAAVFVAGSRWGAVQVRLEQLSRADADHASKGDVAALREQLAEIRGMFRLSLKDDRAA